MFLHIWVVLFILLNSISLYGRTTVCLPMHQLLDHWVLSRFLLWKNCSKLLYKVFVWTYVFISLAEYLQTKWLSCGKCILNFIRKWQIVLLSGCTILHFQQQCIHTKTLCVCVCVYVCVQLLSCVWLCNPMECSSLPGSSVHQILQSGILKWVVISYSISRYVVVCNCGFNFLF